MEEGAPRKEGWLDRRGQFRLTPRVPPSGSKHSRRLVEGRTNVRDPRVEHPEITIEFWKRVFKDNSSAEEIQEGFRREHSSLEVLNVVNGWTMHRTTGHLENNPHQPELHKHQLPLNTIVGKWRERIADPDASNTDTLAHNY